jgi:beta-galactosidase
VVKVSVVDAQGRIVPTAGNRIDYVVSGAGRLLGLGNGDPSSHEADKGTFRSVFNGLGVAIVESDAVGGEMVVEAVAAELKAARLVIQVAKG